MKNKILIFFLLISTVVYAQQGAPANPAMDSLMNMKDPNKLKVKLESLRGGSEKDLSLLLRYYNSMKDEKNANETIGIALKKYPHGSIALVQARNGIYLSKEPDIQERLRNDFHTNFPQEKMDVIDYAVAYGFASKKNVPKTLEYIEKVKDPVFRPQAVGLIAKIMMDYDLTTAEKLVKQDLDQSKMLMTDTVLSKEQRKDALYKPKLNYYIMLSIYNDILIQKQDWKNALTYAKDIMDNHPSKTKAMETNYYYVLSKNGQYAQAFPYLEKVVSQGQANNDIKAELKVAYMNLNPGLDADKYMASFLSALDKKYIDEAAKTIISQPSPDFTVTDINGKKVSLNDFKGKTIVLDFWATWCGPCKASFPAMQRLVDKYKKNQNVKFLFIHTWEKAVNAKHDAAEYLAENHFSMDLYMDLKDPNTGSNPAVSAFKVNGIPAKFIIDGKGNIRFKLTGFSGGDDAAVAEVSAMIDMAKKSN